MWFQFVDISCKASTCVGTKAGTADRRRRPYYPNDSFGCHFLAIPIINIVRTSKKYQKHFDRKYVKIYIKCYWRFEALMLTDCRDDLTDTLKKFWCVTVAEIITSNFILIFFQLGNYLNTACDIL